MLPEELASEDQNVEDEASDGGVEDGVQPEVKRDAFENIVD
jgi:hypothetical protein